MYKLLIESKILQVYKIIFYVRGNQERKKLLHNLICNERMGKQIIFFNQEQKISFS